MTRGGQTEKPAGAWSAQETVLYMVRVLPLCSSARHGATDTLLPWQLDRVREGQFYILVPDNETRREVDALRVLWAAGDVAEGRPALSRWHKDYKALFEEYVRDNLAQLE